MIDKPVTAARIFYGDGTTRDIDSTTDFKTVVTTGVQVVCLRYNDGTGRIMLGHDYYWRSATSADDYGAADTLTDVPSRAIRFDGSFVSDAVFVTTVRAALVYLGVSPAEAESAVVSA